MKYERRIVAFLDVLGFRQVVMDETRCEQIGSLLKLPYSLRMGDWPKLMKLTGMMMTSISDSLVLSIKAGDKNAMNKMIRTVSVLHICFLKDYDLLLRGGIAVGKLYHDDQIVYGPALVKAYELEQKRAIYPRVLIDEKDLEPALKSCSEVSREVNRTYFPIDDDGEKYLNSFVHCREDWISQCEWRLQGRNPVTSHIAEKIEWLKRKLQEAKIQHTTKV